MEVYVVIDEYRDLEDHHDFKGVFGDELEAYKFALDIKILGHNIKVLPMEVNIKPKL